MLGESKLIDIWNQRSLGAKLPKDLASVTRNDIDFFCNHVYPFLQLVNSDAVFSSETKLNLITAMTSWILHDYGEAISTSTPKHQNQNKGIMEQVNTAAEIAHLIATKGWTSVELIDGSPLMKRFLWIESKRYGFELTEYTPTEDDKKCYERLLKSAKDNGITWKKKVTASEIEDEDVIAGAAWGEEEDEEDWDLEEEIESTTT